MTDNIEYTEIKVFCPRCQQAGLQSRVYVGSSYTTLLDTFEFYDEQGRHHLHNPNCTTTSYSCSNGHAWQETRQSKCWCEEK